MVRALLMFALFTVAILANRLPDLPNSIILAALLLLAIAPEALFSVSFQLTFTAVFAIVLFTRHVYPGDNNPAGPNALPPGKPPLPRRLWRYILLSLACSAAASLGTAPLILHHFSRISLLSTLVSLLVGPLFCFVALPLGFAASLLFPVCQPLAELLVRLGGKALQLSAAICEYFSRWSFAELYLPPPSWTEVWLGYGFLLALLFCKRGSFYKKSAALLAALLFCVSVQNHVLAGSGGPAKIIFLDVGQGSAAVVRLPDRKTYLIDGGRRQRDGMDVGRTVIGPYLLRNNIRELDGIVLTHPHADHCNGLRFLLQKFPTKRLWVNTDAVQANPEFDHILQTARQAHTEIRVVASEEALLAAGEYRLSALNAAALLNNFAGRAPHRPRANDGLVLKLSRADHALLFPGDIGRETEEFLATTAPAFLRADLLLASHHGSHRSNTAPFLAAVDPCCIVVSTSERDRSLSRTIVERTDPGKQPLVLTTARQGAVTAVLAEDSLEVWTEGKNSLVGLARKKWALVP